VTHPGAEAYLREVFRTMRELGIDFCKTDFVYAGAVPTRRLLRPVAPEPF
jgi:alpha-galactosidase